MIGIVDGFFVAAQVRLLRQVDRRSILIVEGHGDAKALEQFVDDKRCDIEVSFGKKNAIQALDLLEEDGGYPGVVGVVDADFDRIIEVQYPVENICVTDHHDLDLVLFFSGALGRLLREQADEEKMRSVFGANVDALCDFVLERLVSLSCFRFVSERDGLNLYFKDLEYSDFVDLTDLTMDAENLAIAILQRSNTNCSASQLLRLAKVEEGKQHDLKQLTNGHDAAAMLGLALQCLIGARRRMQTWASEIESSLRLAFDWDHFEATNLHAQLRMWELANPKFGVLRRLPQSSG
jgi:hypothetical protein